MPAGTDIQSLVLDRLGSIITGRALGNSNLDSHPSTKFTETANNDHLDALATADRLFPIEEHVGE